MNQYTKNALWIYWTRGADEVELADEKSSDSDDEDDVAEIFSIGTNVFNFETPTAYIVGNTLRYQYLEWYKALEDGKLKEKALKNKAIMEGMIDEDDESHDEGWRSWDNYENTIRDHEARKDEERCELFDNHRQETPVCNIIRFKMSKYSFGEDEEYVAIKENGYDDLTNTNEDACRSYK
nr:hypothetical protein [Tanacetum cinerariifolium]